MAELRADELQLARQVACRIGASALCIARAVALAFCIALAFWGCAASNAPRSASLQSSQTARGEPSTPSPVQSLTPPTTERPPSTCSERVDELRVGRFQEPGLSLDQLRQLIVDCEQALGLSLAWSVARARSYLLDAREQLQLNELLQAFAARWSNDERALALTELLLRREHELNAEVLALSNYETLLQHIDDVCSQSQREMPAKHLAAARRCLQVLARWRLLAHQKASGAAQRRRSLVAALERLRQAFPKTALELEAAYRQAEIQETGAELAAAAANYEFVVRGAARDPHQQLAIRSLFRVLDESREVARQAHWSAALMSDPKFDEFEADLQCELASRWRAVVYARADDDRPFCARALEALARRFAHCPELGQALTLFNAGNCYLLLGNRAKAKELWRELATRYPSDSLIEVTRQRLGETP